MTLTGAAGALTWSLHLQPEYLQARVQVKLENLYYKIQHIEHIRYTQQHLPNDENKDIILLLELG